MGWSPNTFVYTIFFWQCLLLILFGVFVEYEFSATHLASQSTEMDHIYPMYQDVHVMIFIGFGCLMMFAAKYSFSAIGLNFLISALCIQWALLTVPFWEHVIKGHFENIGLGIKKMIDADFAAGSVMVTFGALLGKVTPVQLIWVAVIHLVIFGLNFSIGTVHLQAVDMGGSIFVHMYGAFFGVGVAWMFGYMNTDASPEGIKKQIASGRINVGSSKTSDMFAMLGCIFLWMFWPSFNGGLSTGAQQHRVVINTVLALSAGCVSAFGASMLLRGKGKWNMVDIQNATLAAGVGIGSSSDLQIDPWGAILVGMITGIVSVIGYVYIQPALEKLGLHDTCGVNNLHGIPGFIGAVGGCVSASISEQVEYGQSIGLIYPAMATSNATLAATQGVSAGEDRTASYQAGIQIGACLITLVIALVGGGLTGLLIGSGLFEQLGSGEGQQKMFDDSVYWEEEGEEEEEHHEGEKKKEVENKKEKEGASSESEMKEKKEKTAASEPINQSIKESSSSAESSEKKKEEETS